MTRSWPKYYACLTKQHKDKYDLLNEEFYKALANEKIRYNEFDILHDILKASELFKDALKYNKEIVEPSHIRTGTNEYHKNRNTYNEMINIAEQAIVGFQASRQIMHNANRITYICKKRLEKFRSCVYTLYELPKPICITTDDITKQCSICCMNIKDHTLHCGHLYCIECINKMNPQCPLCKKSFIKDKVIKLYL
jgi:hypothetical protein